MSAETHQYSGNAGDDLIGNFFDSAVNTAFSTLEDQAGAMVSTNESTFGSTATSDDNIAGTSNTASSPEAMHTEPGTDESTSSPADIVDHASKQLKQVLSQLQVLSECVDRINADQQDTSNEIESETIIEASHEDSVDDGDLGITEPVSASESSSKGGDKRRMMLSRRVWMVGGISLGIAAVGAGVWIYRKHQRRSQDEDTYDRCPVITWGHKAYQAIGFTGNLALSTAITKASEKAHEIIAEKFDIHANLMKMQNMVIAALRAPITRFQNKAQHAIVDGLEIAVHQVEEGVEKAQNAISDGFENAVHQFEDRVEMAQSTIANGIESAVHDVEDGVMKTSEAVSEHISRAVNVTEAQIEKIVPGRGYSDDGIAEFDDDGDVGIVNSGGYESDNDSNCSSSDIEY